MVKLKASCLCRQVKIEAESPSEHIGACHCSMCRKWSGGPLLSIDCNDKAAFSGKENIAIFDSSEWAERGFCSHCGTHLFYRLKHNNQYFIPVGLFESDVNFIFDHQVFIDEKPSYYCFSNQTKNMTGEEVFAQYAPSE